MKTTKEIQDDVAEWDIHAHVYTSSNKFEKWIADKRIQTIKKLVDEKGDNLKVLDAGCGDGFFLESLSEKHNVIGSDIAVRRLYRSIEKTKKVSLVASDCYNFSFKNESFDVVVGSELLEHVTYPEIIINEMMRVTKKGGSIIVSSPNENNWRLGRFATLRFPITHKDHIYKITPKKLRKFFGRNPVTSKTIPALPYTLSLIHIHEFRK